jgi:hypothetical protein
MTQPVAQKDIERILRDEFRTLGFTSIRDVWSPPGPYDLAAERAVCTTCWEGAPSPDGLRGEHFYSELCGRLFIFGTEIRDMGREPTIDLALRWLESKGYRAPWLREEIESVIYGTATHLPLAPLGNRIVTLSRRRQAKREAARLMVLLDDVSAPDDELERAVHRVTSALQRDAS